MNYTSTTGISIRDLFAAIALNGILSSEGPSQDKDIEQDCQKAYKYADAMIVTRHSTQTQPSEDVEY